MQAITTAILFKNHNDVDVCKYPDNRYFCENQLSYEARREKVGDN